MEGYIVKNKDGSYLSKKFFWYPHKKNQDAWVHPLAIKMVLKGLGADKWEFPPVEFIRTVYYEKGERS